MTVLTALQSAAVRLYGRRPTTFFGAQGSFEGIELTDMVNEVAQDVAQYQDWQALQRVALLTGGSKEYALPSDYARMMTDSAVQDPVSWLWGYYRFASINDFLFQEARGFYPWPGGWIIYDNKMRFSPTTMGDAQFPYISNAWALPAGGGAAKTAFDNDTDSFALPERLLTLGLVWRWRENKKLDASGDQEAFVKALDEYASKDGGSKVQRYGYSARLRRNVGLAYPGGWC